MIKDNQMKKILISLLAILLCQSNYANTQQLFNVTPNGATLNVSTVKPSHNYPTAGIKIDSAGYQIDSGCTPNTNNYCLFPVSDTQPAAISFSGPAGTMDAILCLNGRRPLSCQYFKNISVSPAAAARYIYVATPYGPTSIFVCTVNPISQVITACTDAGGGPTLSGVNPQGIVLNNTNTRAYISDGNGSSDIYHCDINSNDGTFSSCIQTAITSPSGYSGNGYGMLTINNNNTLAYLLDTLNNDQVDICPISAGFISGTCVTSNLPNTNSQSGEGIVINRAANTIYLADYGDGVYVCDVNGSTVNSCVLKIGGGSVTFNSNAAIALSADESLLYVTDYGNNEVYFCETTPNGTSQFDNCSVAAAIPNAAGIAINAQNTMAYVTDFGSNIYSCPIKNDHTFDTCTATTGFTGSIGVAIGY